MKKLLLLLVLFVSALTAKAGVEFTMSDIKLKAGEKVEFAVNINNDVQFKGFELCIFLPEGISFQGTSKSKMVKVTDRLSSDDGWSFSKPELQGDGSYKTMVANLDDEPFEVGEGAAFYLLLQVDENATLGEREMKLGTVRYSDAEGLQVIGDITSKITIYQEFTVTAAPADEKQGTVTGGGSYDSGSKVTVTATAAAGYEFVNWTSGETVASTENPYEFTVTEDIKLTAHFQAITYNLTYDLANGALPGGKTNPATYTVETDDIVLVNPELTGYDFAGWTGTDLTEATKAVTIAKGSTGDRSYTATWTATKYAITYDLAGGKLADGDTNPASYTIESDAITLKNPTREGYTFAGWTGTDLTEASTAVTIAKGSMGARTYTATWTPITYTITYDLDGGAVATANPATYTIESEAITLVNPTKDGFDFAGWTGTGLTEATKNVTIAKGSTGDRTYTATWTPASGIKAIFSDSKTVNVYRVNGSLVGRDMTVDEVIQLKHGVYVVNGKKIAIK